MFNIFEFDNLKMYTFNIAVALCSFGLVIAQDSLPSSAEVENVFPVTSKIERDDERLGRQIYNPRASGSASNERPQPYDFGFNIQDEFGNNQFRQETGDANGAVSGTYGYTDALGIYRRVKYIADADGYRAEVKSNEPGVKQENPASSVFQVEDPPQGAYVQVSNGGSSTNVLPAVRRSSPGRRFPAAAASAVAASASS